MMMSDGSSRTIRGLSKDEAAKAGNDWLVAMRRQPMNHSVARCYKGPSNIICPAPIG